MKIGFVHYNWKKDGITTVMLNNSRGLREGYSVDIKLIGGEFVGIPDSFETCFVQIEKQDNPEKIAKGLEKATEDCDSIIIENPMVGSRPVSTLGYKIFSEGIANKKGQKIIWRHHDFVYDMSEEVQTEFIRVVGDFEKGEGVARTNNVLHTTLISYNKKRLEKKGLERVEVLADSVVAGDFFYNKDRAERLRDLFESNRIIYSGEKALVYPSRVLQRKNMSEALLLTKILSMTDNYRLIITLKHTKEDYQKKLRELIEDFDIPCSLGEAGEHIGFDGKKGYVISDLYSMSDLALTTAVEEGFGYGFVEPWLVGVPLIGRDISRVTEDFSKSGMHLEHLYGDNIFKISLDENERVEEVRKVLRDASKIKELENKLRLEDRIKKARENVEHNNKIIREKYDYVPIAKQLYGMLVS